MISKSYPLTHARLDEALKYDRSTGVFTWRIKRGRISSPGDEAGTVDKHGRVMIGLDGVMYAASRLAWFYVNKEWPEGRLGFRDGNPSNLRYANLLDGPLIRSKSPQAKYQRELRDLNEQAAKHIRDDPELMDRYNFSPMEARRTLAMVRDELRARNEYTMNAASRRLRH